MVFGQNLIHNDWPNLQTVCLAGTAITGVAFGVIEGFSSAMPITKLILGTMKNLSAIFLAVHSSARIFSIGCKIENKNYYKIALDLASASLLFLVPYGWVFAIAIDLLQEAIHCVQAYRHSEWTALSSESRALIVWRATSPMGAGLDRNQLSWRAVILRKFSDIHSFFKKLRTNVQKIAMGFLAGTGISVGVGSICSLSFPFILLLAAISGSICTLVLLSDNRSESVRSTGPRENLLTKDAVPKFEPTDRLVALRFLSMSEEEAKNPEALKAKYEFILGRLESDAAKVSSPIAIMIRQEIEDLHIAYQTLQQFSQGGTSVTKCSST